MGSAEALTPETIILANELRKSHSEPLSVKVSLSTPTPSSNLNRFQERLAVFLYHTGLQFSELYGIDLGIILYAERQRCARCLELLVPWSTNQSCAGGLNAHRPEGLQLLHLWIEHCQ